MSTSSVPVRLVQRGFGETMRRDVWWTQPLLVFLGLSAFLVYATWAAFQGEHYTSGPYLSPFYSPEIFGPSRAQLARTPAGRVASLASVLAGAAHPADSRALPADVLLLPRRLLQGVLGGSPVVHRRRAAVHVLGRELVSAHPPELPSLHAVHHDRRSADSRVRRLEGDVVHRSGHRGGVVRDRRRHAGAGAQRGSAQRISARLSFAASRRRRLRRSALLRASGPQGLFVRELPQSAGTWCGHGAACSP